MRVNIFQSTFMSQHKFEKELENCNGAIKENNSEVVKYSVLSISDMVVDSLVHIKYGDKYIQEVSIFLGSKNWYLILFQLLHFYT